MDDSADPSVTRAPHGETPHDDALERSESRMRLLLHVGTFQLKLVADWLRDLLLVPASLFAAAYGIVFGGNEPEKAFKSLLRAGRRSDRFINLFNQHEVEQDNARALTADELHKLSPAQLRELTSDELLAPYRDRLLEQAQSSKLTAKASRMVDGLTTQRESEP